MNRDRAMLMTGAGSAAIAVVRLAGEGVQSFLRSHFSKPVAPGRCVHGELCRGDRIIDDPVVVVSHEGRVADINLHGGPWVVRSCLELAREAGFEIVERAGPEQWVEFVDGDTILEREIAAYLPLARTELALRTLLDQQRLWGEWVRGERSADAGVVARDRALHWLLHPPRVATVGVPNVGKSTLANQLFAQERSITADLPGTTRDWVGEIANIDGLAVMLVDTPGVRETADDIERRAIEGSTAQVAAADLVVLVLDPTQEFHAQAELMENHPGALLVINKADREARWDVRRVSGIATVATTGAGVDQLRARIKRFFGCEAMAEMPRWWTARQRGILDAATSGDAAALRRVTQ